MVTNINAIVKDSFVFSSNLSLKKLGEVVPAFILQDFNNSEFSVVVSSQNLNFLLTVFKKHFYYQYSLLSCISGVDLLKTNHRFFVAYDLLSLVFNTRIRVKVFLDEYDSIPSVCSIFVNANWWEREVWDLFGIFFTNHPDLRRILTDYGFEGYPLRKDFPLCGFRELRYDNNKKSILSEPVSLSQEFRAFYYETPW